MNVHEDNLTDLAERVRDHIANIEQDTDGLSWFLVGGAVRDALLDREPNDFDFVVVGENPEDMMDREFRDIQATSFPVWMDSEGMEWALARTENKAGDGYHGFEIETEGVSLFEDLDRRDLSINSMALGSIEPIRDWAVGEYREIIDLSDTDAYWDYDVIGGGPGVHMLDVGEDMVLIDRHMGVSDLEHGVLHPATPKFKEDPIRVMRLARYAARFPDLDPSDDVIKMGRQVAYELNRCSRERIGDEIVKAMEQAEEPRRFWEVLRDTGALAVIFPELDRATLVPAGPEAFHSEGRTFEHTALVLDRMHELCEEQDIEGDLRVRRLLMAVAHDIGKVIVADEKGGLLSDPPKRFAGHAPIGASHIPHIAQGMGLEKQYEKAMQDAAEHHMDFYDVKKTLGVENHDEEPYNAQWAQSFLSNFDHEHDPTESTIYGATPWEMLDLTHADHEGRIELRTEDGVSMSDVGNTYETHVEDWDAVVEEVDAEIEEVRPEFDREPYERVMSAVYGSIDEVDGYTVMREGLCDGHGTVGDDALRRVIFECDECRTPGPWIGNRIDELRMEEIVMDLGGDDK